MTFSRERLVERAVLAYALVFVVVLTLSPMEFAWPRSWAVVWWRDLQDLPANVLFFIPVGYLSARCRRSPPHRRRPIGLHAKQQLELDNAQLKASNASLEQELKIGRLNIGVREADVAARTKELSDARGGQTRLEARNTQLTTRLEEVVTKYKEAARTVQELEASKELMEREVKLAREVLAQAQEKTRRCTRSVRRYWNISSVNRVGRRCYRANPSPASNKLK